MNVDGGAHLVEPVPRRRSSEAWVIKRYKNFTNAASCRQNSEETPNKTPPNGRQMRSQIPLQVPPNSVQALRHPVTVPLRGLLVSNATLLNVIQEAHQSYRSFRSQAVVAHCRRAFVIVSSPSSVQTSVE